MWEAIWALLEKLLPQLPTRAEMDRSFEGLLNRLPGRSRQPERMEQLRPLDTEQRAAAQKAMAPLDRAEQVNQQSADRLSKLQQMLDGLGKPRQEVTEQAPSGASHVIVDNAKDIRPEAPSDPLKAPQPLSVAGESPTSRLGGLMKKLEDMQSPEWRGLTDAERGSRYSQRFQSRQPVSRMLTTDDDGNTIFRWQRPRRSNPPVPPAPIAPTGPAGRQTKSLRSRLGTIWRWKTRPQKLVNLGRKLQLGAGRLMSVGGGSRVVSGVASGMSRLGVVLEGLGMSRVAGVVAGITGLAVAAPAAVAGIWGLVKGAKAAGESLLSDQRRLAEFSGVQSRAAMITNISQIRTDMAAGRDTGPATVELAKEMAKFRQAMQPLESTVKNVELKAATWGASFGTAAASAMNDLINMPVRMHQLGQDVLEDAIARMMGGDDAVRQGRERRARAEQQRQQQQMLPAQEFLQGLRQAMGQPGGRRQPLDPL